MELGKKKKVILLTIDNVNENIKKILLGTNISFLVILFFSKNYEENKILLETTKKYFEKKEKNSYLKDVIIISEREYLANDLLVKAVITPYNIHSFRYFDFVNYYENCNYENSDEFIKFCATTLNYKYDLYNDKDPWIYHQNNTNVLVLTEDSHQKIMENYHKIKNTIPQIIVSIFTGNKDEKLINLLKLIGADAELTLTFINNKDIAYNKRSDVYIYIENENFKEIGFEFINDILYYTNYPEGISVLKKYMNIPDKNFDVDIFYDEAAELDKKEKKYYTLNVIPGNSLRREFIYQDENLIFNMGLQKKYVLSKYNKM